MNHFPITRRESLKRLFRITSGFAIGSVFSLSGRPSFAADTLDTTLAGQKKKGFLVEAIGQKKDYAIKTLTRKIFEAAGGMQKFISKGDVVVIKPNLSWARPPHLAATTNPEVMEAVIELCQEAGAKKVRIADNTIHSARRCFAITGAESVAKKTGADLIFPRSSLMQEQKIRGNRLDVWPVFTPLIEADKVINLPIAKVHNLCDLTLGMKSWIGAVGGRRNVLHQDIHQTIVDLAQFFKPTVTLIDAIRVMIHNGPSGGRQSDVVLKNRLILSNDPVAADAKAAELFGLRPEKVGFIRLGEKWGLGTYDFDRLDQKRVFI